MLCQLSYAPRFERSSVSAGFGGYASRPRPAGPVGVNRLDPLGDAAGPAHFQPAGAGTFSETENQDRLAGGTIARASDQLLHPFRRSAPDHDPHADGIAITVPPHE